MPDQTNYARKLSGPVNNVTLPAFLAYLATPVNNCTGDSTLVAPVIFDTEICDQGANYDPSTGFFTAPVTGKYQLSTIVTLDGLAAGHNYHDLRLVTTNRTYICYDGFAAGANPFIVGRSLKLSVLADMDANEIAYVTLTVSGSTKVVDIWGAAAATDLYTYFCGHLVC